MKRLLTSLIAVFFAVSPAPATELIVAKPDVPQGYETWPYQFQSSCVLESERLEISLSIRLNPAGGAKEGAGTIDLFLAYSLGGQLLIAQYLVGDPRRDAPDVARYHIRAEGGWEYLDNHSVSYVTVEKMFDDKADYLLMQKFGMGMDNINMRCNWDMPVLDLISRALREFNGESDQK